VEFFFRFDARAIYLGALLFPPDFLFFPRGPISFFSGWFVISFVFPCQPSFPQRGPNTGFSWLSYHPLFSCFVIRSCFSPFSFLLSGFSPFDLWGLMDIPGPCGVFFSSFFSVYFHCSHAFSFFPPPPLRCSSTPGDHSFPFPLFFGGFPAFLCLTTTVPPPGPVAFFPFKNLAAREPGREFARFFHPPANWGPSSLFSKETFFFPGRSL